MKILTDFCKTVETGVDPCMKFSQWILFKSGWKVTPVWFCSLKLAKFILYQTTFDVELKMHVCNIHVVWTAMAQD